MSARVHDFRSVVIRDHAREQMNRRQIREDQVRAVPAEPEVVLPVRPGRVVAQRIIAMGQPPPDPEKEYLFRVFVDVDRQPPELVTVYRTSQIRKYRSKP